MMQYPELSFGQMMQKVAEHWRNLDPRDKEIYQKKAEEDKLRN